MSWNFKNIDWKPQRHEPKKKKREREKYRVREAREIIVKWVITG